MKRDHKEKTCKKTVEEKPSSLRRSGGSENLVVEEGACVTTGTHEQDLNRESEEKLYEEFGLAAIDKSADVTDKTDEAKFEDKVETDAAEATTVKAKSTKAKGKARARGRGGGEGGRRGGRGRGKKTAPVAVDAEDSDVMGSADEKSEDSSKEPEVRSPFKRDVVDDIDGEVLGPGAEEKELSTKQFDPDGGNFYSGMLPHYAAHGEDGMLTPSVFSPTDFEPSFVPRVDLICLFVFLSNAGYAVDNHNAWTFYSWRFALCSPSPVLRCIASAHLRSSAAASLVFEPQLGQVMPSSVSNSTSSSTSSSYSSMSGSGSGSGSAQSDESTKAAHVPHVVAPPQNADVQMMASWAPTSGFPADAAKGILAGLNALSADMTADQIMAKIADNIVPQGGRWC